MPNDKELRKSLTFKTSVRVGQVIYWNDVNASRYSGTVAAIHYAGVTYRIGITADLTITNVRRCS